MECGEKYISTFVVCFCPADNVCEALVKEINYYEDNTVDEPNEKSKLQSTPFVHEHAMLQGAK